MALTLAGFGLSSALGIAPVWVAVAGAAAITRAGARAPRATTARTLVLAAEPSFLVFVLGLGVIVRAASDNGLADAARALLPSGVALPELLAVAAVSAILANLVNNLPATLILVPVAAPSGAAAVLAVLIGVNVGPEPDLRRLARHAAVAARPARRGPRGRARRVRPPRGAHRPGGPRRWRPCSYGSARRA